MGILMELNRGMKIAELPLKFWEGNTESTGCPVERR